MKKQSGFVKVIVVLAVLAVGGAAYLLYKKSTVKGDVVNDGSGAVESQQRERSDTQRPKQAVYIPAPEEIIRIVFPRGGEELEIGKTYGIRWDNYVISKEPLTVGLQVTLSDGSDGAVYLKKIAKNVPASVSGSYLWTVTSELAGAKYKVEVYPEGERPNVGRSEDFFLITGEQLIDVTTPQPLAKVSNSIVVRGKARRIFSEGEFIVRAAERYSPYPVIAENVVFARDCDWMSGVWCNFETQVNLPKQEGAIEHLVMLDFYQRDEAVGNKLIYQFPVSVGNR